MADGRAGPSAARPTGRPAGEYTDIRYETAEGIAKITIDRPEVRNAFRPQTLIELSDALERAREDTRRRRDRPHRRGPARVLLGRRPARARRRRLHAEDDAAAKRGVGRFHVTDLHVQMRRTAQADRGDGRRLRDRRRPRAAHRLRPHDRRRQRALRPDRAAGRQLRRRLRRRPAGRPVGPEEGEGDLVPLPPVRRAAGARDGPREHGRAARGARGGDRALVPRDARALALRAAAAQGELQRRPRTASPASSSSPTTPTSSST